MVLAWCHAGTYEAGFGDSVAGSFLFDANQKDHRLSGKGAGFISLRSSPRIAEARNQLVTNFLRSPEFKEATWLVMVDTDMLWPQHAVHQLVATAEAHDYKLAGGLCFAGSDIAGEVYPTIYVQSGTSPSGYPTLDRVYDYPRNMIVECDATGAAFLAIHRDVLNAMGHAYMTKASGKPNPYPWFEDAVWDDRQYGEDIGFCIKARALGFKLMVHTGVPVGHLKTRSLDEAEYDRWRAEHDDRGPGGDPAPAFAAAGRQA